MHNCSQYEWAQLFLSLMIILRNVSWAVNQHIIIISEGSCDTEDWSNVFYITGMHYILIYKYISPKLLNGSVSKDQQTPY